MRSLISIKLLIAATPLSSRTSEAASEASGFREFPQPVRLFVECGFVQPAVLIDLTWAWWGEMADVNSAPLFALVKKALVPDAPLYLGFAHRRRQGGRSPARE